LKTDRKTYQNSDLVFPLYLLIFTVFIFPIAWGGRLIFDGQKVNPEFYSILIPQHFDNTLITVLVFLGGLSSCISMIIISAITLSIMLSNNLIIPYGLLGKLKSENENKIQEASPISENSAFSP
jgi:hypothetical protein